MGRFDKEFKEIREFIEKHKITSYAELIRKMMARDMELINLVHSDPTRVMRMFADED